MIDVSAKIMFWDFDGVIKESTDIKTEAYACLFNDREVDFCEFVRTHHLNNVGLSRFEKITFYLNELGEEPYGPLFDEYASRFSQLVKERVIQCEWVNGVQTFINMCLPSVQMFILTATPLEEMRQILASLGIADTFTTVIGAPQTKDDGLASLISKYELDVTQSVYFGDSFADYQAAQKHGVPFLLRRHEGNFDDTRLLGLKEFNDFCDLNLV